MVLGTAGLSVAKILENMEIGHNVMHGQWDWMNDPNIHSSTWDWDTASPAAAWKHSHNYVHHTYTNVIGKDKDVGYEILRIDPRQPWKPAYLFQPIYNLVLMAFFEWGVALHDLDFDAHQQRREDQEAAARRAEGHRHRRPAARSPRTTWRTRRISAASSRATRGHAARRFWANFTANIVRNVWSNVIIFCGHFPDQTFVFTEDEVGDETRGGWYVRQMIGAANIDGSPLFHIMCGNLSFQVEHHLYPDMPSSRYQQIAPRVKEICEKLRPALQHRPAAQAVGRRAAHHPAAGLPGRRPAPEAGPVPPHAGREAAPRAGRAASARLPVSRPCTDPREPRKDPMKLPIHLPDPGTLLAELPRPHKPTPMSELSWPRRIRRVFGLIMLVSMGGMAVSASTASTDWDVRGDGPPPAQRPKDEDDSADGARQRRQPGVRDGLRGHVRRDVLSSCVLDDAGGQTAAGVVASRAPAR